MRLWRSIDLVVPCSGQGHKVRLDVRRLIAAARCPKCRSPVDPTRTRRLLRLLPALYRATSPRPAVRLAISLSWGYLAVTVVLWVGLWSLSDVWWPMTVLLFGPRWIVLAPLAGLVPAATVLQRRLLVPLSLALLIGLGPIMGFRLGWRSWFASGEDATTIRVATFNVEGGNGLDASLPWIIDRLEVDVLALQECGGRLSEVLARLPDVVWHHHRQAGLCLVSRFPIQSAEQMERDHFQVAGGAGVVIRYALDVNGREINLTNLHLETPRAGLEQLREGDIVEGQRKLESKSTLRDIESRQARRWVDQADGPFIVVGDFNLPVESAIYERYWNDLRNAFSHAGFGFGHTRITRWVRARIDHVLLGAGCRVENAFVGPDFGSDHLPMVADVILPPWSD